MMCSNKMSRYSHRSHTCWLSHVWLVRFTISAIPCLHTNVANSFNQELRQVKPTQTNTFRNL